MKIYSDFTHGLRVSTLTFTAIFLGLLFFQCADEREIGSSLYEDDEGINDYLKANENNFSEFGKLVELTKTKDLIKGLKNVTFFLPTNSAMLQFYKDKKVASLNDFTDEFRQTLLRNHVVPSIQNTKDIFLGALQDTNALGDYLSTDFMGADIIVNKTSKITTRNVPVSGNLVHVVDNVIDLQTKDIYSIISNDTGFSIFTEGLQLTGLEDTLRLISYPYQTKNVRTRFTLLPVPDSTYSRLGIESVSDLIDWCGKAETDEYDSKEHPLYRYFEYHCLSGTYYLNSFNNESSYPSISQVNSILMTVTDDYKINLNQVTGQYTGFILNSANISAKNGVIHPINNLMPLPQFQEFKYEPTNIFEITQGSFYKKDQKEWTDGQNSFSSIKFESERLQYKGISTPAENYLNGDYFLLTNFKWIEISTPVIPAGKYQLSSKLWLTYTENFPLVNIIVDDKFSLQLTENQQISNLGQFNWKTAGKHRIRIECPDRGIMTLDYLLFSPLN
jgi:uncharacterized surface protein with fasciclin (FAS1) repeats